MSIYITGDIHGVPIRFSPDIFYEQKEMTNQNENYVIILGDFGLIWQQQETSYEKRCLDWLENKPFFTLFIDGNHENHERLATYPVKEWNGGQVHEIRPHVLHLMRGQVFTIENKKFFTFGGASSHDIKDGIIDYNDKDWKEQVKKLEKKGKYMYRINHLTWWEQELPTEEEMKIGLKNLAAHDYKVDYILSHSPSASITALLSKLYKQDVLTYYLEDIRHKTEFKKWFFGHMHIDRVINEDIGLYEQIIRIV